MFFIRTSVQAIEPWLCFIVIFPGGYLSNFFCIFFAKVFFFVITSIFNFPNWNLRIKILCNSFVIFVTLSNMTSATPSFPFFPLWEQTQHHRERGGGGHIWKGYSDYKGYCDKSIQVPKLPRIFTSLMILNENLIMKIQKKIYVQIRMIIKQN